MNKTIFILRIFFLLLCIGGSWLFHYTQSDLSLPLTLFIGTMVGCLAILVDIFLKGFSLRGLTALTFGLGVGALISWIISISPLFEPLAEPRILEDGSLEDYSHLLYLTRLSLFVILMYLGAVIAMRGRDEFNLVIPYIRFVPHGVDVPLVVVDTSALIDGRIVAICRSKWMGYALVIPRFVLEELQNIADSADPQRKAKGRKGISVLNDLRKMENLDLRIHESEVSRGEDVDAKLVFLSQSLKAKLLTMDYNLAKMAEFQGVKWLNINDLVKALNPELSIGERIQVQLVKAGKESGQAVGFLPDGSMVVVNDGKHLIGSLIEAEVMSIIPSGGGKLVFANPQKTLIESDEVGTESAS
jgi:uncharacterized protein YacL